MADPGGPERVLTVGAVMDGVSDFVCCAELHKIANFLRQRTNERRRSSDVARCGKWRGERDAFAQVLVAFKKCLSSEKLKTFM